MFFPNNGLFITFFRQNLCLRHPEGPLAVNYEILFSVIPAKAGIQTPLLI